MYLKFGRMANMGGERLFNYLGHNKTFGYTGDRHQIPYFKGIIQYLKLIYVEYSIP